MRVFLLIALTLNAAIALAQKSIRITVANNVVLVPLQVNGRKMNFLLDTGSESSALDTSAATTMRLPDLRDTRVEKNYHDQIAGTVEASTIESGKLQLGKRNFAEMNLAPISRAIGTPVDGVLGNDILADLTFKLNYSRQELVFAPLARLGRLGKPIHLRRSDNQFFLPLHILSTPTELLLDTGTNSTNLSWATWQRVSRVWNPPSIIDGVARAGSATPPAFLVCIPTLEVGSELLPEQSVRVQRAVNSGAFSSNDFGGIAGSDLFRQFETVFDLKHETIYVKKDLQFHPDPYRYVTVGIQFAKNAQQTFSVMSVWKGSPADKAGIHMGDRITAVDGESSRAMTTEELSGKLHGPEGTAVNLILERNGTLSAVSLRTRQMLCQEPMHSTSLRAAQP